MTQENALRIFKCLSDRSRLRIIQSLTQGDMYTELLAERLELTPSTVSFHMKKLEEAGLVVSRKEQYYTVYALNRDVLNVSLLSAAVSQPDLIDEQQKREDAYRQKVLDWGSSPCVRYQFEYGKLKSIPVQRKKKLICYEVIAARFVPGRVYSEKEANEIISVFHEDYCTIRRDMIGEGILSRNGGEYIRLK